MWSFLEYTTLTLKPRANGRVRLHTLLRVVGSCCAKLETSRTFSYVQQLPTKCWELLCPFARSLSVCWSIFVTIAGVAYNIPVCIWLQESHPKVAPLVFVKPKSSMAIKPSHHVDTNGKVYLPFLHEWSYVCDIKYPYSVIMSVRKGTK